MLFRMTDARSSLTTPATLADSLGPDQAQCSPAKGLCGSPHRHTGTAMVFHHLNRTFYHWATCCRCTAIGCSTNATEPQWGHFGVAEL